jgi:hypothetical protein
MTGRTDPVWAPASGIETEAVTTAARAAAVKRDDRMLRTSDMVCQRPSRRPADER